MLVFGWRGVARSRSVIPAYVCSVVFRRSRDNPVNDAAHKYSRTSVTDS
jgi:hypothetical protein